jgi:hypothetical protein
MCALVLFRCGWAGTEPRKNVLEYPAHLQAAHGDLGVEYFGRAYDGPAGAFFAEDYLVIEVMLYAEKGRPLKIQPGDFRLRLNGATREWGAVTAGTVALAIRQPGMDKIGTGVVVGGGVGPGGVVLGGPRTVERFPGDPRTRGPNRPAAVGDERESDVQKAAKAAVALALEPVRAEAGGAGGLLYFHWRGKTRDLKKIELIYDGEAGRGSVRLR